MDKHADNIIATMFYYNTLVVTQDNWFVGELFLGKANESTGVHIADGQPFTSRPDAMRFWYKYDTYSSDNFLVEVKLYDANNNVIATGSAKSGTEVSQWTSMNINLSYSSLTAKAAKAYVSFKASDFVSGHKCDAGGSHPEVAGTTLSGDKQRLKLSTTLKIDDVEFIYNE